MTESGHKNEHKYIVKPIFFSYIAQHCYTLLKKYQAC
jgi:hypothetical protein